MLCLSQYNYILKSTQNLHLAYDVLKLRAIDGEEEVMTSQDEAPSKLT